MLIRSFRHTVAGTAARIARSARRRRSWYRFRPVATLFTRATNTLALTRRAVEISLAIRPLLAAFNSPQIMVHSASVMLLKSLSVPSASTSGCTGITTFIKEELVADGGAKPNVRPPGAGFRVNAARFGLSRGRKFDRDFQRAVSVRTHTQQTLQAFAVLQRMGIVPVKCQQRVVMAETKLTTLIDAVGVRADGSAVCIELKTCQLSASVYTRYSDTACGRTPLLRCIPSLPNTERSRHSLQSAFGALCLQRMLAQDTSAVVVVCCHDRCIGYDVPRQLQCATRFRRLMRVPPRTRLTVKKRRKTAVPKTSAWPPLGHQVGRAAGLSFSGGGKIQHASRGGALMGVAVYAPLWPTLGKHARTAVLVSLQAYGRKVRGRATMLTPMVLCALTRGGRAQITMAGPPFKV